MSYYARSNASDEWGTPLAFFDKVNSEFNLELDVCANPSNAKLPLFITKEQDGLTADWFKTRCWMNPPYSKIVPWIERADREAACGKLVVALLPAKTCTRWFHGHIYNKYEIRFIKGRLKFGDSKINAPFPSMLVIFKQT
jgi:phage N-6-adenine-methyltransferase